MGGGTRTKRDFTMNDLLYWEKIKNYNYNSLYFSTNIPQQ